MKTIPTIKKEDVDHLFEDDRFPDGDGFTEAQREKLVKDGTHVRTSAGYIVKLTDDQIAYRKWIKNRKMLSQAQASFGEEAWLAAAKASKNMKVKKLYVVLANTGGKVDGVTVFAVCRRKERAAQHEHALKKGYCGNYFKETIEIDLDE